MKKKRKKRYIVIPLILVLFTVGLLYRLHVPKLDSSKITWMTFSVIGGEKRELHQLHSREAIEQVCNYINALNLKAAPNEYTGSGGYLSFIEIYEGNFLKWTLHFHDDKLVFTHGILKKSFNDTEESAANLGNYLMEVWEEASKN